MSRLRRIEQQDRIFFVTSNLARGVPNLSETERDLVLNSLGETRTAHKFLLFGYVVMPDHVHAVLAVISGSLFRHHASMEVQCRTFHSEGSRQTGACLAGALFRFHLPPDA